MHRSTTFRRIALGRLLLTGAALFAAGCAAPILDWSPDDAPKALRVDISHSRYPISFAPSAAALGPAETAKLSRFVALGGIQPDDRLIIEAGNSDALAVKRRNAVVAALRRQGVGVSVDPASVPGLAPDRIVVAIERAVVTLPDCPNWSKPPIDYSAQVSSNFGCATATNLGLMVADPRDLVQGRRTLPGGTTTTVGAIQTYDASGGRGAPGAPSPFPSDFSKSETAGGAGAQ